MPWYNVKGSFYHSSTNPSQSVNPKQHSNDEKPSINIDKIHAFKTMYSMPIYHNSLINTNDVTSLVEHVKLIEWKSLPTEDWSRESPSVIMSAFIGLSKGSNIDVESESFKNLVQTLKSVCLHLDDDNIICLLASFDLWKRKNSTVDSLSKVVCQECINRLDKWDLNRAFKIAELIVQTRLYNSDYIMRMLKRLSKNLESLETHHLVQFIFFGTVCRKFPRELKPNRL